MALENHHVYILGDTSSNACFSIVVLVFGGVVFFNQGHVKYGSKVSIRQNFWGNPFVKLTRSSKFEPSRVHGWKFSGTM